MIIEMIFQVPTWFETCLEPLSSCINCITKFCEKMIWKIIVAASVKKNQEKRVHCVFVGIMAASVMYT